MWFILNAGKIFHPLDLSNRVFRKVIEKERDRLGINLHLESFFPVLLRARKIPSHSYTGTDLLMFK